MTVVLVTVTPAGHKLAAPPAASYRRMSALYGGHLPIPQPLGAYRTRADQAHLRRLWLTGNGSFALPAGHSVHELGYAADFGAPAHQWLTEHAAGHGWRRTNPNEAWHYEYTASADRHLLDGVHPIEPIHPIIPTEEPPMLVIVDEASKRGALIYPSGRWAWIATGTDAYNLAAAAGTTNTTVNHDTFAAMTPDSMRLGA